jgi:hypothetical protein
LAELLAQEDIGSLGGEIRSAVEHVIAEVRRKVEQELRFALQRVNLHDDRYRFLRAIDGDTIEVAPPGALEEWMRDVHIRLYGIDAPERGQEKAQYYTELLKSLCSLDNGNLSIVWERERRGTEYAGFPLSSFERGIGNVFVDVPESDGRVLYVNAFLACFPEISLTRDDKPLLRGSRVLRRAMFGGWPHHWPHYPMWWPSYYDQLHGEMEPNTDAIRSVVRDLSRQYPWYVPWLIPRRALENPEAQMAFVSREISERLMHCGCSRCREVAGFLGYALSTFVEREKASVFDALLILAKGSCP